VQAAVSGLPGPAHRAVNVMSLLILYRSGNSNCKSCFGWKKQITKLQKEYKKTNKKASGRAFHCSPPPTPLALQSRLSMSASGASATPSVLPRLWSSSCPANPLADREHQQLLTSLRGAQHWLGLAYVSVCFTVTQHDRLPAFRLGVERNAVRVRSLSLLFVCIFRVWLCEERETWKVL
jgi:hypothetical protein